MSVQMSCRWAANAFVTWQTGVCAARGCIVHFLVFFFFGFQSSIHAYMNNECEIVVCKTFLWCFFFKIILMTKILFILYLNYEDFDLYFDRVRRRLGSLPNSSPICHWFFLFDAICGFLTNHCFCSVWE